MAKGKQTTKTPDHGIPYERTKWGIFHDILLTTLAAASVAFLVVEETHHVPDNWRQHFLVADFTIAIIFLTEWIWGIWRAKNKKAYWQAHWYELLASIPLELPIFEALRGLRILRIFRVLRIAHAQSHVERVTRSFMGDLGLRLLSLLMTAGTIVFSGAVAFHQFEFGINPLVRSFWDSFWWAMTTTTTVVYGDIYPVTWEGRVVAMLLTLVGVGVLGAVIGFITNYIVKEEGLRRNAFKK